MKITDLTRRKHVALLEADHGLISALKRCLPVFCLLIICSAWASSFLSPVNGKLNIVLPFQEAQAALQQN